MPRCWIGYFGELSVRWSLISAVVLWAAAVTSSAAPPRDAEASVARQLQSTLTTNAKPAISSENWGTVHGRVTFVGDQKSHIRPRRGGVQADPGLVVHRANRGLKNVVVWVYRPRPIAVHPAYDVDATGTATITRWNRQLLPRIQTVRAGQALRLVNRGPAGMAPMINFLKNSPLGPALPAGAAAMQFRIQRAETIPIRVSDSIVPWLTAYLMVQDHPYMAVSDANGVFELANLPYGQITLKLWHESFGYLQHVTWNGQPAELTRGKLELSVDSSIIDVGKIELESNSPLP